MAIISGSIMALKLIASQGLKKAAVQTAKNAARGAVKNKAKNFVTGKGKKGKKGKGGALVKSEGGQEEGSEGEGGGAIVPTTPMVGSYRVETGPQKPDLEGKPAKVSYESINNQLDSIIALTEVLKKTSAAKVQTAINRGKAERKAAEKSKKRSRESMLEGAGGAALGLAGNLYGKATQGFDPLKFFTMIFLGSLLKWVTTHGSKITALLKGGLFLFNNGFKLLSSGLQFLGKTIKGSLGLVGKIGSPITKLGNGIGTAIRGIGQTIGGAFTKLGNSIKNFGKGILNKLKAAGKILTNPLSALTGPEKKAVKTNQGLNKLLQKTGTGTQNLGTAARPPGTLSNATRSMRLKHGDEAARMYQGLVDNGMKPGKAAQYVNKSIQSGKLTSAPLQGNLAGGKPGSQLFKGGVGRSTNRVIARLGGKTALKVSKGLMAGLKRIPIVGSLITGIVSILAGDPAEQTLFKIGGAALGGALGSVIPVFGTIVGEIIGEWVGDLLYHAIYGGKGDVPSVGEKFKQDWQNAIMGAQWLGDGFGRLYEGLPKFKLPNLGWANPVAYGPLNLLLGVTAGVKIQDIGIPNPFAMLNPFEMVPLVHKAFFTEDPMEPGEVKEKGDKVDLNDPDRPAGVTNMSTVKRDTKDAKFGDFIMGSDGSLRVFDGRGTRGLKEGEQELFDSGAINIDGTKGSSTSVPTTSKASYWGPLLETIAKKESVGGSYDSIYPGTTKQKKYGGKALTEMTIAEADAWQASTASERGSAAAGRYQFMQILSQAKAAGLSGTDMFSAENQDKMAISLIVDKRKITPDMIKNNPNEAMIRLGMEWAAFPMPVDMQGHNQYVKAGQSYYAGDGRNASGATVDEMRAAFTKLGAPPVQPQASKVDLPETYTTAGVTYDLATGLPISGHESRQSTPDNSDQLASQEKDDSSTSLKPTPAPAQVTSSAQSQSQMSTAISQQLPYEETGSTMVMVQGSNGQQTPMVSGGGKGTPIIMGSGDVVNSYYKSQVLGFLYKQG